MTSRDWTVFVEALLLGVVAGSLGYLIGMVTGRAQGYRSGFAGATKIVEEFTSRLKK